MKRTLLVSMAVLVSLALAPAAAADSTVKVHLLDTGHFALEEDGEQIASHMRRFLDSHVR